MLWSVLLFANVKVDEWNIYFNFVRLLNFKHFMESSNPIYKDMQILRGCSITK